MSSKLSAVSSTDLSGNREEVVPDSNFKGVKCRLEGATKG